MAVVVLVTAVQKEPVVPKEDDIGGVETPEKIDIVERGPDVASIDVDGAVVDAIQQMGGLASVADSIGTDGIVVKATNRIESLQGISEFHGSGAVVAQSILSDARAHQLSNTFSAAGNVVALKDWDLQGATGFSLRFNIAGSETRSSEGVELVFESLVREHSLVLHFSGFATDSSVQVLEYRVTLADGKPLPGWLDRAGPNVIFGKWPVSIDTIELNVTAILSDGETISRQIRIQTNSGEIQPLDNQKSGWVPRTFTNDLRMHASSQRDDLQRLAAAFGW